MINLQDLVTDPRALRLGIRLSQLMPTGLGQRVAWWLSGVVCQIKPAAYRILQANLHQVLGPNMELPTLEETARQVFYSTIRSSIDLFRALRFSREELGALVDFPEEAQAVARSLWHRQGGSVLVFPHLGSFDLAAQAFGIHLPEPQVLTLPNPSPGFQLANALRQRSGVDITPLSSTALRQAIARLKRGGLVSIAGDRPVSDFDELVPFFGRPARVPSGHVRLALKTGAVVTVGCCFLSPETGKYTVHMEPPLEMLRTGNREEEVILNMRRVLDLLESTIRRWIEQWQMYVPVWPELAEG